MQPEHIQFGGGRQHRHLEHTNTHVLILHNLPWSRDLLPTQPHPPRQHFRPSQALQPIWRRICIERTIQSICSLTRSSAAPACTPPTHIDIEIHWKAKHKHAHKLLPSSPIIIIIIIGQCERRANKQTKRMSASRPEKRAHEARAPKGLAEFME